MDSGILVIVLEMLGDSRSTKQIVKISSILFLPGALFFLKAEELPGVECLDDVGR